MANSSELTHPLHQHAQHLAHEHGRVERELIGVLQKIDGAKLFREWGYGSLFEYTTRGIGLSESVAYALIVVARRAVQVPELKAAIDRGDIGLSKAKRMTAIITIENAETLIEKAKAMTCRELEREVAILNPQATTGTRMKYLSGGDVEIKMCVSHDVAQKLKRAQDLMCQRTKKVCSMAEVFEEILEFYLERKDPVRKSERILNKPVAGKAGMARHVSTLKLSRNSREARNPRTERRAPAAKLKRPPIPAAIKHKVTARDQGQCTHQTPDGTRCTNTRWIELHHKIPVHLGGTHNEENMTTLCSGHHQQAHAHATDQNGPQIAFT